MSAGARCALLFLLALPAWACQREAEPAEVADPHFRERENTGVTSNNTLYPTEAFNIVEYLYFYNGGGVAATDISGDGLPDLYFTNNQGPNRYYVNEGNWHFRDATEAGGVAGAGKWSTGVSVLDVNGDGRMDLYVCNVDGYKKLSGKNELFVQQADGSFVEEAAAYGLDLSGFSTQAYWFDYDLDGDQDMYLLRHSVHNDATYGEARFREQPDSLAGDLLLRNDGGSFIDVTARAGIYSSRIGYGLSAAIADYDGNGYPDIYVCNDFSENDYLYLNGGGGGFREVVRERTGHTSNFSMGSDVADFDRDGRPDILTLDMRPGEEQVLKSTASADAYNLYRIKRRAGYYDQLPRNNLQWNRGHGNFSEIGELAGLAATDWSWSVLVEDFDLDGSPEVFVANGIERRPNDLDYLKFISSSLAREASNLKVVEQMPSGHVANQLFVQKGPLAYAETDWGLGYVGSSSGAAVADFDGDGDLDLVINNVNAPAKLYENLTRGAGRPADSIVVRAARQVVPGATLQRGFMSQSQVAAGYVPLRSRAEDTVAYTVTAAGSTFTAPATATSFDREPLQPYADAGRGERGSELIFEVTDELGIVAGMWMPVSIATSGDDGIWQYDTLAGSGGWWQSVSTVDGAHGRDLILGNWGLNSTLGQPDPASPLRLYLQDIDGNGREDPLITYVRAGREYSLAGKDELAGQFPSWRRNNLSYAEFSKRSFRENFPDVSVAPKRVETLAHVRVSRDAAGAFTLTPLPPAAQITPLNVARQTPVGILLGGNKLDVLPSIGRQDAAALQLLRPDGRVQFIDLGGERNRAEVRSITAGGPGEWRIGLHTGETLSLRF